MTPFAEPSARQILHHLASQWQRPEILEAIFDQLSDALFIYDKELLITGVNQSAQRMFGMSAQEMIGRYCRDVFHCIGCDSGCEMRQHLGEQAWPPSRTVSIRGQNGIERLVVIRTIQIVDDAGMVQGIIATVKDITAETKPAKRQIIAESQAMRELLAFTQRIAVSEASSILIEGENGTGKDLIAKMLHYQSLRQAEPFLAINCAAIPDTLLESELFGYEKGAFTDARAQKRGLFELADKGTLFLDEIGEIPLSLQVKLLRALEEQCFRRLGGLEDIHVDLRIIGATNKNLREAVKEGAFRQDLYYRLNVIQLTVPPLRDRPQDILPLARFFIDHYNVKFKRKVEGIAPESEGLLLSHDWPGNVRELRNAMERAMILEDTAHIRPASLPIAVRGTSSEAEMSPSEVSVSRSGESMSLVEQERRLLVQALEKTGGNQTHAARLLRITRDTLRYKMKKFNLR